MYFEKVSYQEWRRTLKKLNSEVSEEIIQNSYKNIKLPKRATIDSAGYDFFNPFEDLNFPAHSIVTIPTGISFRGKDKNCVLIMVPRSGLGFKYGMGLRNTIGVIDADYQYSDNEGHIMLSIVSQEPFIVKSNSGLCQGIILPFLTIDNEEEIINVRNGGFGSTTK